MSSNIILVLLVCIKWLSWWGWVQKRIVEQKNSFKVKWKVFCQWIYACWLWSNGIVGQLGCDGITCRNKTQIYSCKFCQLIVILSVCCNIIKLYWSTSIVCFMLWVSRLSDNWLGRNNETMRGMKGKGSKGLTDKQKGRQADRQTDRETDRNTYIHTYT